MSSDVKCGNSHDIAYQSLNHEYRGLQYSAASLHNKLITLAGTDQIRIRGNRSFW